MGASNGICRTDKEQPIKNCHVKDQKKGVPWVCDFVQQRATKCIDAHVALGYLVNRASKHQNQDRDGGDFPHSTPVNQCTTVCAIARLVAIQLPIYFFEKKN